jgi:hypothetical protein
MNLCVVPLYAQIYALHGTASQTSAPVSMPLIQAPLFKYKRPQIKYPKNM